MQYCDEALIKKLIVLFGREFTQIFFNLNLVFD